MTALAIELRRACSVLLKTKGFTAAAVLTLALGMTLCTTAMVVVKAYLLSGLPYPAADRLYWIRFETADMNALRGFESLDWSSLNDVVEHPIAWDLDVFYMLGGDHAESFPGAWVTPGFVQALGIQPAIGRGFDPGAFVPGAPNVALISHRLWTERYARDPAIVGRTFAAYVSDRPNEAEQFTIIGVLPQGFWHINAYTDVLVPLRAPTYPYMARLRHGVSPATATERIKALVTAPPRTVPAGFNVVVVSAHEAHVLQIRPVLQTTAAAAGLVLLVGCANLAGLLLVRAARRERELAIRAALGAGSGAIARMLIAEAIVIGVAATVLALVGAWAAVQWLQPVVQQQLGRSAPGGAPAFALDLRVFAGAMTVGILTAIGCAVFPLIVSLRTRLLGALQSGNRSATEGKRSQRIRAALIAVEVAASLTLLSGSALMIRSVLTLLRADLGFSADRVLQASITLRQNRYPDGPSRTAAFDRMLTSLMAIPGVEVAGLTTVWPVQQPRAVTLETAGSGSRVTANAPVHAVSDRYFETLGITMRSGRSFAATDRLGAEPIAIVSEALAKRLWPAGNAVGSRIFIPEMRDQNPVANRQPVMVERLVVGIVRDVRQDPADSELADLYVPVRQMPSRFGILLVRTAGAPAASLDAVRAALREVDPELAVDRARPLQAIVDGNTARPKFMGSLLSVLAIVAAALALVGVYGVIAYAVRQREREIAVRLAVGATPAAVTRLFVRQGGTIIAAGLVLGVVATLAAGRLIESQLHAVTPRDPVALLVAVSAFALAGLGAVWWPARRAAATDPAIALKSE